MKKQLELNGGGAIQLGFEWVCMPAELPHSSGISEVADISQPPTGSVVDLTPVLHRRAAEYDRALLKAVQIRAAHLSDCLLKQS